MKIQNNLNQSNYANTKPTNFKGTMVTVVLGDLKLKPQGSDSFLYRMGSVIYDHIGSRGISLYSRPSHQYGNVYYHHLHDRLNGNLSELIKILQQHYENWGVAHLIETYFDPRHPQDIESIRGRLRPAVKEKLPLRI